MAEAIESVGAGRVEKTDPEGDGVARDGEVANSRQDTVSQDTVSQDVAMSSDIVDDAGSSAADEAGTTKKAEAVPELSEGQAIMPRHAAGEAADGQDEMQQDPVEQPSPRSGTKRRQSSGSGDGSKRRKVEADSDPNGTEQRQQLPEVIGATVAAAEAAEAADVAEATIATATATDTATDIVTDTDTAAATDTATATNTDAAAATDTTTTASTEAVRPVAADPERARNRAGVVDERKRGKRLFGGLLGTLSQSSLTAAQRRRVDIDKKQQEKLKQQREAIDQKQKTRLDALTAIRRQEQAKFDKQSMRICHANVLAMARFLSTKTKPKLYYKPWELRPEEEERIKRQLDEAESRVDRELQDDERGAAPQEEYKETSSFRASSQNGFEDQPVELEIRTANGPIDLHQQRASPTAVESDGKTIAADGNERPGSRGRDGEGRSAEGGEAEVMETGEDSVIY